MSRVEGVVEELLVEEGDFVREGQTLCILDDTDLQINLKLTKQQIAQARIQLEQAKIEQQKWLTQIANTKSELQRQETALKEQLVSEQEVDSKKCAVIRSCESRSVSIVTSRVM